MKFKRFFLSVLKSAAYVLLFFLAQLGVTVALVLLLLVLSPILVYLTGTPVIAQVIEQNMVAIVTVLSNLLFLSVLFLWFAARGKSLSREVGWYRMPRTALAVLGPIEVGFGASILASFVLALLPVSKELADKYEESMQMLSSADPIPLILATVIAAPIAEEVLFRGLIYKKLKSAVYRPVAALFSAVVFGLVHGTVLHLIYTIPMGLLLCVFYEKYRSLWAPILMHMSFNLGGSLIGYYNFGHPFAFIILFFISVYLIVVGFCSVRWYRREVQMPGIREDAIL